MKIEKPPILSLSVKGIAVLCTYFLCCNTFYFETEKLTAKYLRNTTVCGSIGIASVAGKEVVIEVCAD